VRRTRLPFTFDSFRVCRTSSADGNRAVFGGEDPWLCVPASRRVCPGRSSGTVEQVPHDATIPPDGPRAHDPSVPISFAIAGQCARAPGRLGRAPVLRNSETAGRPAVSVLPPARTTRASVPAVPCLENERRAGERGEDQNDPEGLSLQCLSHRIRTNARRRRW